MQPAHLDEWLPLQNFEVQSKSRVFVIAYANDLKQRGVHGYSRTKGSAYRSGSGLGEFELAYFRKSKHSK